MVEMPEELEDRLRDPFCLQLLFELTIVGRDIWSDDSLQCPAKLDALKWLNEINHRLLGALRNRDRRMAAVRDQILHHAAQAPLLAASVESAWNRSLRKVTEV